MKIRNVGKANLAIDKNVTNMNINAKNIQIKAIILNFNKSSTKLKTRPQRYFYKCFQGLFVIRI